MFPASDEISADTYGGTTAIDGGEGRVDGKAGN
jgi:hypothetical protein